MNRNSIGGAIVALSTVRMRTRALLGTAGVATAGLVAAILAGPGTASADTGGASCKAEYDITISPGLSVSASSGTFTTGGQTGSFVCDGTVDGKEITGPGTFGDVGRYGIARKYSCLDAEGDAELTATMVLPTADGPVKVVDNATRAKFGPLQGGGVIGGTFEGPRIRGSFTVDLIDGNCVTAPVTKVHISLQAILVDKP